MSRPSILNSHSAIFTLPSLLVLLVLLVSPASAHKIHVFASAKGTTIEGEVYASGNQPIRNAAVTVLGPRGEKLGETATDDAGAFRFVARQRVEHTFVVDTGDGHHAKYRLPANELPASLPPSEKAPPAASKQRDAASSSPGVPSQESLDTAALHEELEAVHAQVVQLRKQLDAYEQQVRLHDILGGVGVILGLMGASFYFLGVLRKEKAKHKE
jgi:nickel transport protein